MSQFKSRLQIFHEENGEDCILVGNRYIYSNGAHRDQDPMGMMTPPPHDPFDRARLQVSYHEQFVAGAVTKHNQRQEHWRNHAASIEKGNHANDLGPYKLAEIEDELASLKAEVEKRRKALAEAQAEMNANAPKWYKDQQQRAARQAENQQGANVLRTLLDRLRI